ncbi:MAG: hypothetical protein EP309_03905 [Gammaproteobacteria bacterium]|nr:MAG: hypothetical protein EP309_03905 [Gammaproteobacteria bacterium]
MLRRLVPFLVAFVLPLLVIYAWWGGFSPIELQTELRGPYEYAYVEHTGDYSKLPDRQAEAGKELVIQGIKPGLPITVLYSNPDVVNVNERKARVGFLIPPGSQVQPPLQQDRIEARSVLVARVQAAALLAPSRIYHALDQHQQAQGRGIRMPTVEIYEPSGSVLKMGVLTVEMEQ